MNKTNDKLQKKTVEEWIQEVDYSDKDTYVPSKFALEFITFIKLVNGEQGEEHKTPVMHMKMLDEIHGSKQNICNLCYRGASKTTLLGEYLFLYIAVYGGIPGFGDIPLAMYISDSVENGVKNMRKNLEHRWNNSDFLQKYVPRTRFTDTRYEFENATGKVFIVKSYGAKTGVRGAKEMGQRPYLAVLDDIIDDDDARSPTVIASIEDTIYKAVDFALHPSRSKVIWSGTPYNQNDPLYKAVESGGWYVNVYPVCKQFPCKESEFEGAWEDRHTYEYVKKKYDKAISVGKIAAFNQELMLRIMSDEDRLITDNDIAWYDYRLLMKYKNNYNYYITTDFATSEKNGADFSVLSVWAYSNNGDWYWVDGVVKRQTMDKNINDLFRLVGIYKPDSVGIEISGQQGGFISWIKEQQINRNMFFRLAGTGSTEGIKPTTNKMVRFNTVVPLFKLKKILFPKQKRNTPEIIEAVNELSNVTVSGFKSKHDDVIDTISMLSVMQPWKPTEAGYKESIKHNDNTPATSMFGNDYINEEEGSWNDSYIC